MADANEGELGDATMPLGWFSNFVSKIESVIVGKTLICWSIYVIIPAEQESQKSVQKSADSALFLSIASPCTANG